MTCKDCFHNGECGINTFNDDPICKSFKDKSKIVELPCKVGDTVYIVDEYSDEEIGYDECKIEKFIYDGISVCFEVDKDQIDMFDVNLIGEKVFLTREEAEKALKEEEK